MLCALSLPLITSRFGLQGAAGRTAAEVHGEPVLIGRGVSKVPLTFPNTRRAGALRGQAPHPRRWERARGGGRPALAQAPRTRGQSGQLHFSIDPSLPAPWCRLHRFGRAHVICCCATHTARNGACRMLTAPRMHPTQTFEPLHRTDVMGCGSLKHATAVLIGHARP